jgi:hypothetical protein
MPPEYPDGALNQARGGGVGTAPPPATLGELIVGDATVKTHVARVLMKLGLRDRVQAVVFAYKHGIVEPGGDARP